jgi:hypothetical protein
LGPIRSAAFWRAIDAKGNLGSRDHRKRRLANRRDKPHSRRGNRHHGRKARLLVQAIAARAVLACRQRGLQKLSGAKRQAPPVELNGVAGRSRFRCSPHAGNSPSPTLGSPLVSHVAADRRQRRAGLRSLAVTGLRPANRSRNRNSHTNTEVNWRGRIANPHQKCAVAAPRHNPKTASASRELGPSLSGYAPPANETSLPADEAVVKQRPIIRGF